MFSAVTDSIIVPPVSAAFQFFATMTLNPDGSVTINCSQPSVQLLQWYANLLNSLTGGTVATAVSAAIASALSSLNGSGSSGLIDLSSIKQFTSLGTTVQLPLTMETRSVEIHSYGLAVHGTLDPGPTSRGPVAAFDVIVVPQAPGSLIFNAQSSWCPGDRPASYLWDFGDGTSESSAGNSMRFVTTHTYPPGAYQVCLTVTDSQGRSASVCRMVTPRTLNVTRVSASNESTWVVCKGPANPVLSFVITSSGLPVSGATMLLSSRTAHRTGISGADGSVVFQLPLADFSIPVQAGGFALGAMTATISAPGFVNQTHTLLLSDCAAASVFRDIVDKFANDANQLARDVLDPLGPVATVREKWLPFPDDPATVLIRDIVLAAEALSRTAHLLSSSADLRLAGILLGDDAGTSVKARRKTQ